MTINTGEYSKNYLSSTEELVEFWKFSTDKEKTIYVDQTVH